MPSGNPNLDSLRAELYRPKTSAEVQEDREAAFNRSTTSFLFASLKLQAQLKALAYEKRQLGLAWTYPTIADFNRMFPTFPLYLTAKYSRDLHEQVSCGQVAMFRNFRKSTLYRWYQDSVDEARSYPAEWGGRPCGLIVPRLGLARGLIVHESVPYHPVGLQFVFRGGPPRDELLIVQPLSSLLTAMYARGHGWRP